MEIRLYRHEIEHCNVSCDNISADDVEKIMSFYKIPGDVDEVDYDNENCELIFYINPCKYW